MFFVVFLFAVVMEEFVARVFKGGKITIPKLLRELFYVEDGDYVRLALRVRAIAPTSSLHR